MKVVIDTNVWVSALVSKDGASRKIIRLALQEKIEPQISTSLFMEHEDVMHREKIQKSCALSPSEQQELFEAYLSTCRWNEIFYMWRPNLTDANDDFLVELAVASNAEAIITKNIKDIVSGELGFDFEVVTPETFLRRIKK